jgi:hypothetical protein
MPAHCQAHRSAGARQYQAWPQRGLDRQREIDPDPGAKKHRQPEQVPIALGGETPGNRGEEAPAPRRHQAEPPLRDRRIRHRRPTALGRRD